MTDIIIIGAGTAGLSAAIYAQRAGKSAVLIEESAYGGQIINTPDIENYPGIGHISGFEFAQGLYEQATNLGAVVEFTKALSVTENGGIISVETSDKTFEAKALIIATGAKNRPLGLDKEQKLIGSGVSYCATCDGAFFKGKDVAVMGGGNTALEDAQFLSGYCNKVYLIHRRDAFRGDKKNVDLLNQKENIEFVLNSTIEEILGEDSVAGVKVKNKVDGSTRDLEVSGLFVAIGQMPDNEIFRDFVDIDDKGYVIAGEDCKTRTPGFFVAGDCRTKTVRQLTTAASDGAVAALAACAYIDEN